MNNLARKGSPGVHEYDWTLVTVGFTIGWSVGIFLWRRWDSSKGRLPALFLQMYFWLLVFWKSLVFSASLPSIVLRCSVWNFSDSEPPVLCHHGSELITGRESDSSLLLKESFSLSCLLTPHLHHHFQCGAHCLWPLLWGLTKQINLLVTFAQWKVRFQVSQVDESSHDESASCPASCRVHASAVTLFTTYCLGGISEGSR